ncbi:MAG: ATP-binding protein [Candidatus Lokiarchaeota archaeon]|nr:ATP-binding protein [Candidatus Lokiarchaeota archaeon]
MDIQIGTIFNYNQLPDVSYFPFIINKNKKTIGVKKGLFVCTESKEGFLIGIIEKIILLNEYYSDALTIKTYNDDKNTDVLKGLFPSEDFEFALAIVKCLGIIEFNDSTNKIRKIHRMTYPANPGGSVYFVDDNIINEFIGIDIKNGLNLGVIKGSHLKAMVNIDRLLNKHFAILSISGGGKSYLTSILIEELLSKKDMVPCTILIDVHGEYSYLKKIKDFTNYIDIQNISYFQIATSKISSWAFKKYQQQISHAQVRELSKYIQKLNKNEDKKGKFSLSDIIELIESDTEGSKNTKQALIGWLSELEHLHLFGHIENPNLKNLIKKGKLIIFSLENETSLRKKQIIIDYLFNRLFSLRRTNKIPPILLIVEEAHQLCPEASQSSAISKRIIETIAREGRKFMTCLCLISQRPKKLSTTALSQMNSKMVLNIKNPYDLKHLMDSSEAITKENANMISSLGVGEMVLMGNAVNYPIFIDVRERNFKSNNENLSLTNICLNWQDKDLS